MSEPTQDSEDKRLRSLTLKGEAHYASTRDAYLKQLTTPREKLDELLERSQSAATPDEASAFSKDLQKAFEAYEDAAKEVTEFLSHCRSDTSVRDLQHHRTMLDARTRKYQEATNALQASRTRTASSIRSSTVSSLSVSKRAKAEAGKARVAFAKRELELKKQKAELDEQERIREAKAVRIKSELDAELSLLEEEKIAAAADAEATVLETEELQEGSVKSVGRLPHTLNYVMNLGESAVSQQVPTNLSPNADMLSTVFLRKELLLSRLSNFGDKPEAFQVWKQGFQSVARELAANPREELDLLVKYLGPESSRYADSIRTANATDPGRGVALLWERLEDRFGSPELVESSLKAKIEDFPTLTSKDNRKLCDLCDLVDEVQATKTNPKLAVLFAVYDSSTGVNTIVRKLPHTLRQKWISQAARYKEEHQVPFPPFTFFAQFMRRISKQSNDPAFQFQPDVFKKESTVSHKVFSRKSDIQEGEKDDIDKCPIHKSQHGLDVCKAFRAKEWEEKMKFLKQNRLCFKCLRSGHNAKNCHHKPECDKCKKGHLTAMHNERRNPPLESRGHGGEDETVVSAKCTSVCSNGSRSCGKIVLTRVYADNPDRSVLVYAILDDQSNRSLASTDLLDQLGVKSEECAYQLSSCAGTIMTSGRKADDLHVQSLDGQQTMKLPPIIECENIPDERSEIPTPDVALRHRHLNKIVQNIPHLDQEAPIGLLIGRDLPEAHHVLEQLTGPPLSPFAQRLSLGWAVVGEVCLDKVHKPAVVHVNKMNVLSGRRGSIFEPCQNTMEVKEVDNVGSTVFQKTKDDEKPGLSIEDKKFVTLMDANVTKNEDGCWVAPLPFRDETPAFNNKPEAKKRALTLHRSLSQNPTKKEHMFKFMTKVIDSGAAEVAPKMEEGASSWYLPLFGVYHPQKPDKIRGVFDSSAKFQGCSLNDMLLSGPDLTNSLVGILLRFRRDHFPIAADVEQMFYQFFVNKEHRDYLRFFWYQDNDFEKPLVEYRMRVHVFGNSPSPAVATYGLRKAVASSDEDVRKYVEEDFYVDDGVASLPRKEDAVSLMERTKTDLMQNGKIRLHKIASSDREILQAFSQEDLGGDLQSLDFSDASTVLPVHKCLGLGWNLNTDSFILNPQFSDAAFTRRGLLSTLNGIYDPLGFLAPAVIAGKILLREIAPDGRNWDEILPAARQEEWENWRQSLESLKLEIPRKCVPHSLSQTPDAELHIFCDASEKAIASVAYTRIERDVGFVMGKAKLAPVSGHTIPRLELCSAVLAAELYELISDQLHVVPKSVTFHTDSKVVLGYICNETRRFHTYVSNRVERIRRVSSTGQWKYIPTNHNPADTATRGNLEGLEEKVKRWLDGPQDFLNGDVTTAQDQHFPLICPDDDKEIRVNVLKTDVSKVANPLNARLERFSSWATMIRALSFLRHICRSFHSPSGSCKGWHVCSQHRTADNLESTETYVLEAAQKEAYPEEIKSLRQGRSVHRSSPLFSLSPYLSEDGLLRVGGRLRHAEETVGLAAVHPVILPRKHHVSTLLVRHFHERVKHQGRHFTEGALRSAGYWIVGAKRLVASEIHDCLLCKRLRGVMAHQQMANLSADRVVPSAPFSHVGVDVFGPWSVVTRKTRGGAANSKRWAVVFTCLTIRAIHIEVIEEMSSSSFINALTRFTSLRGPVTEFRSDRGTNFIGAANELGLESLCVENGPISDYLSKDRISWKFNPPHASHMGGVWERMIGVIRRILDSMLLDMRRKPLTHENLCTLMAEVCAVVNGRPIVPISHDPDSPFLLTPSVLLTYKSGNCQIPCSSMDLKDMYKSHWKHVQVLSDTFWKHWKGEYLQTLQQRRKWETEQRNVKEGDLVLLRDKQLHRNDWPIGLVTETFSGDEGLVRSVEVRIVVNGNAVNYVRPITELILL